MKIKRLCSLLLFLIVFIVFNKQSYALTTPTLMIASNNYSTEDKIKLKDIDNITEIEVNQTLQLYTMVYSIRDFEENIDDLGTLIIRNIDSGEVEWTSNNTGIATVDSTGKVTGISEGSTTITVGYDGKTASYNVTVKTKSKPKYKLNLSAKGYKSLPSTLDVGEKIQLAATFSITEESVLPEDITSRCTWKSSSKDIATVDDNGEVKAISTGKVTITAT